MNRVMMMLSFLSAMEKETIITDPQLQTIFQAGIELEPVRQKSHVTVEKMTVQRRIDMYFKCKKKCSGYRFPGSNYLWNLNRSLNQRPSLD
jgi:hypothetical protein